jgi:hypothetical protein
MLSKIAIACGTIVDTASTHRNTRCRGQKQPEHTTRRHIYKPLKRLSLSNPLTLFPPCLAQSSSHLGVACTSRDVVKLLVEGRLELVQ